MDQCARCGARLSAGSPWCGQCYTPRGAALTSSHLPAAVPTPGPTAFRAVAPPSLPQPLRRTRWRKTPTTFGPAGRVIATVCLVVPVVFLVVVGVYGDIFALGGAGVWGFVIMPWGLRDVWQAGQLPVR